ncbi:MAG: NUDIX hydrolase [Allomuricauda sp.]|uniref:NUDIX hydrolase n=1 Tax=Allomuricauda sp. ARW1Y1 TaxID=2663843 RepID=UPI0015CED716|nr:MULTISPECIES: NUDIX hydrolase [unclassified Allomuricauda]MBO6590325.1 NUDIX hydrolase [Allomuricauda sp.]MBO6620034.1 NUDIX hydrolase [Allomuricauda sp.]MBO6645846.1 NUDIX hydrolase [Allomuricauda sp.]MBO6748372.1 NUDIX hydrolase [Allomuricauda sp.]MBO6845789.1 NUDIX hydrolase [Allomuricauda sp.]
MTLKKQTLQQEDYIPNLAFDSVIFGFNGKKLKILILEYRNTGLFALPGGFIRRDENLDEAVKNGVRERTGLTDIYLEQFQTFGEANRADPEPMKRILEMNGLDPASHQWLLGRFISVAYYALINFEKVVPKPDPLSDGIDWYALDELPPLMMDHQTIIEKALETLRENLEKKLLGTNLLPEKFTMKELQQVYEAIYGTSLNRSGFQRKMLSSNTLVRHEKRFSGNAHKAPYLYSFKANNVVQPIE